MVCGMFNDCKGDAAIRGECTKRNEYQIGKNPGKLPKNSSDRNKVLTLSCEGILDVEHGDLN